LIVRAGQLVDELGAPSEVRQDVGPPFRPGERDVEETTLLGVGVGVGPGENEVQYRVVHDLRRKAEAPRRDVK
jgi:hypothetical protein